MVANLEMYPLGDVVLKPVSDDLDVSGGGGNGGKDEDTFFGI